MYEVNNMLLNYSVKGYKVFYDEVSFTMIADNYIKKNQDNLIKKVGDKYDLVKSSIIYGPNNTGKSCFLESFKFFLKIIEDKKISVDKFEKNIFYDENMPIEFKVEFSFENQIYYYEIAFTEKKVIQEIFKKNNKIIINRLKNEGASYLIRDNLGERVEELYLNFLPKEYGVDLNAINRFVNSFEFLNSRKIIDINKMLEENSFKEINEIIKQLDLNIDSLVDNREEVEGLKQGGSFDEDLLERMKVFTKYRFHGIEKNLPFGLIDSNGTVRITKLIYTFLSAIKNNKILIIDEIESSLHTLITKSLISYYNSHNNTSSQLIATSHDLLLLDDKHLLRKDQIWFVHKDENGNYLYCLNDFKDNSDTDPRGNVMKKYLKGIFGALPEPKWFDE